MKKELVWLVVVLVVVGVAAAVRLAPVDPDKERDAVYEAVIRHMYTHTSPVGPLAISIHRQPWPASFMQRFRGMKPPILNVSEVDARFEHDGIPSYFLLQTHAPIPCWDLQDIIWQQARLWQRAQATVDVTWFTTSEPGVSPTGPVSGSTVLEIAHGHWQVIADRY